MYTERHEIDHIAADTNTATCTKCGRCFYLPEERLSLEKGECPGHGDDAVYELTICN